MGRKAAAPTVAAKTPPTLGPHGFPTHPKKERGPNGFPKHTPYDETKAPILRQ